MPLPQPPDFMAMQVQMDQQRRQREQDALQQMLMQQEQQDRVTQRQDLIEQRGIEALKAGGPLKDVEGRYGTEASEQTRAGWRIFAAAQKKNELEAKGQTQFDTVLAPAQRQAQTLTNVNTPEFAHLVSQLARQGSDMGATPDQMTPGIATLPFLVQAAEAERVAAERQRAETQRKSLAEILKQQRAVSELGLTLEEEQEGRRGGLKTREEMRFAETTLTIDETQFARKGALLSEGEWRLVRQKELIEGRKLEIDQSIDDLAQRMAVEGDSNKSVIGHRGARVTTPATDWDQEVATTVPLARVPYALARVQNRASQIRLANAPMAEVLGEIRERGLSPNDIPGRVVRGLMAGETSTGRYIAPSSFWDPRTGLPMPGKDGSKDKRDVEENASALAQIDFIEAAVEELRASQGDRGRYGRAKAFLFNYYQSGEGEPNAALLNALRSLGVTIISKGVGQESGAPSNADISRAMQTVPNVLEALAKDPRLAKARILAARGAALGNARVKYGQVYQRRVYETAMRRAEMEGVIEAREMIRKQLGGPGSYQEETGLVEDVTQAARAANTILSIEEVR